MTHSGHDAPRPTMFSLVGFFACAAPAPWQDSQPTPSSVRNEPVASLVPIAVGVAWHTVHVASAEGLSWRTSIAWAWPVFVHCFVSDLWHSLHAAEPIVGPSGNARSGRGASPFASAVSCAWNAA